MRFYPDNRNGAIVALLFVAAAGALAYFGWKKFKSLEAGLGSGSAKTGDTSGEAKAASQTAVTAGKKTAVTNAKRASRAKALEIAKQSAIRSAAQAALGGIPGILNKGANTGANDTKDDRVVYGSKYTDKIEKLADQLNTANKDAAQFWDKYGTTPSINKALAAVNSLNDEDFKRVLKFFKSEFNDGKSYFESTLAKSNLDTYERVKLTNRAYNLNAD